MADEKRPAICLSKKIFDQLDSLPDEVLGGALRLCAKKMYLDCDPPRDLPFVMRLAYDVLYVEAEAYAKHYKQRCEAGKKAAEVRWGAKALAEKMDPSFDSGAAQSKLEWMAELMRKRAAEEAAERESRNSH